MPSFVEIGPLVQEKKNFNGFLPYMGMVFIKMGFDWPSGFREENL